MSVIPPLSSGIPCFSWVWAATWVLLGLCFPKPALTGLACQGMSLLHAACQWVVSEISASLSCSSGISFCNLFGYYRARVAPHHAGHAFPICDISEFGAPQQAFPSLATSISCTIWAVVSSGNQMHPAFILLFIFFKAHALKSLFFAREK